MAIAPSVFQGLTPTFTGTGLSPLQLALATYMAQGTPLAFGPNQDFLQAMQVFSSSAPLSPLSVDPATGIARTPDILTNVIGFEYVTRGDEVYLFRRASDCGPDENRNELVLIGKTLEVATGTWTYYGPRVVGGSISSGSSGGDPAYGPSDVPGGGGCSNNPGQNANQCTAGPGGSVPGGDPTGPDGSGVPGDGPAPA